MLVSNCFLKNLGIDFEIINKIKPEPGNFGSGFFIGSDTK